MPNAIAALLESGHFVTVWVAAIGLCHLAGFFLRVRVTEILLICLAAIGAAGFLAGAAMPSTPVFFVVIACAFCVQMAKPPVRPFSSPRAKIGVGVVMLASFTAMLWPTYSAGSWQLPAVLAVDLVALGALGLIWRHEGRRNRDAAVGGDA